MSSPGRERCEHAFLLTVRVNPLVCGAPAAAAATVERDVSHAGREYTTMPYVHCPAWNRRRCNIDATRFLESPILFNAREPGYSIPREVPELRAGGRGEQDPRLRKASAIRMHLLGLYGDERKSNEEEDARWAFLY